MEHGNRYQADLPVHIAVLANDDLLQVRIVDHGGDRAVPTPGAPDLEAKLAGLQSPRGWGLLLIKNMVDEMKVDKTEDAFWHGTLRALAARFGVNGSVQQRTTLVDPRVQWSEAGAAWHNAAVRTALFAPLNVVRSLFRR